MNISAGLGIAVREFPLKSGQADYLLYADCKALGVIEAKPEGHTLTGVRKSRRGRRSGCGMMITPQLGGRIRSCPEATP